MKKFLILAATTALIAGGCGGKDGRRLRSDGLIPKNIYDCIRHEESFIYPGNSHASVHSGTRNSRDAAYLTLAGTASSGRN